MPSTPAPPGAARSTGARSGDEHPAAEIGGFARRSALGFVAVVLGALLLALVVRIATGPVARLDQGVAGSLNTVVAPRPWLVTVLQVLTAPGSAITAWIVLSTLTVALLIRRRYRLAIYVAVTGLGTAVLSPLLKQLVDRLRPIVDMPVADGRWAVVPQRAHARRDRLGGGGAARAAPGRPTPASAHRGGGGRGRGRRGRADPDRARGPLRLGRAGRLARRHRLAARDGHGVPCLAPRATAWPCRPRSTGSPRRSRATSTTHPDGRPCTRGRRSPSYSSPRSSCSVRWSGSAC